MLLAKHLVKFRLGLLCCSLICAHFHYSHAQASTSTKHISQIIEPSHRDFSNSNFSEYAYESKRFPLKPFLYGKKEGKVTLSFNVTPAGLVKDAQVVYSSDRSYTKEAFKILREAGMWNPGMRDGITTNMKCKLTVTFKAPIATNANLRQAKVIHEGKILPTNKIWYIADGIYLEQIMILDLKQSQALLGNDTKQPTIIIKENEGNRMYSEEIISKLNNIDSSIFNLYINDQEVDLNTWKQALKSHQHKNFYMDASYIKASKIKAKLEIQNK